MLSKLARCYNKEALPAAKRLRANLGDLFLTGQVTGGRGQELFEDAEAAGAEGCRKMGGSTQKNAHRDLLRRLKKGSQWPPHYKTQIRVKNAKTGQDLFFVGM